MRERAGLSALRCAASLFAGSGTGRKLTILIYHRVLPVADVLLPEEPDARRFENHMVLLRDYFNVLPLAEASALLKAGRLPVRAACVTFDDGYADNEEVALPILLRWNIPATFFVSTGFIGGGCMWNDAVIETVRSCSGPVLDLRELELGSLDVSGTEQRRTALAVLLDRLKYIPRREREERVRQLAHIAGVEVPAHLMMRPEQVRSLANAGMDIGGHTVNHPILSTLDGGEVHDEIAHGRDELVSMTGQPVRLFAYPNGKPGKDYRRRDVAMVRKLGFEAAVSTSWGAADGAADIFQLPRFTPWDRSPLRFMGRMLQNRYLFRPTVV